MSKHGQSTAAFVRCGLYVAAILANGVILKSIGTKKAGTQVSKETIDSTFDSMKVFSEAVDGTFEQLQILKETAENRIG